MAAQNRPTHAWTHDERLCVHILWDEYTLSRDDRVIAFNKIFKDRFAVGKSDLPRTLESLSKERSKRHHHGSCSWKAWQAIRNSADDIREQFMVDRMRTRVSRSLKSNNEPATPPQSESSNHPARTTALLCDIAKFASFTESVTSKRNIAALGTPPSTTNENVGSSDNAPRPKRFRHAPRDQSPTVVIPQASDVPTVQGVVYVERPPKTGHASAGTRKSLPVTASLAGDNERAPISYQRMGNMPLMLSPVKYKNAPPTEAPCHDISEEDAHPCLPALLWRYWDSSSQGANSASGFKSGRSAHARVPPRGPPLCENLEWMDVLEHLNPSKCLDHRIHTPFISTSSRLLWLLRKALRKRDPSGCISLIDSSVLDPKGVYYVPPFHTELKKRFVFDHGAQYYKGISEHLVWNEIVPSAMIKTASLDGFCAFVNGNKDVKRLMRLDKLLSQGKLDEISRTFKRDNVQITDSIAVAIAELVIFFGLDHTSREESISSLVYEIAQGWALTPDDVAQSSWQKKAQWFTHTICRRSDEPVSFVEQSTIYHAFLNGLRWSCGDVNVRLKGPKACVTMQKRAAKVGLDHPSHMVISELESAIATTHSSVVRKSQGDELQQVSQSLNQAQAIHDQRGSTQTDTRELIRSSFARRPRMQLMPGEGETQTAIQGGVGRFPFDSEVSQDGVDRQPGDHRAEEDGSNITLARRDAQATNHTSAYSWPEDEILYE